MSSPGSSPASRVADLGERALIERIRQRLPPPPSTLVVGIGDDAAVAIPERGELQVLTTDALVEGIHFDRRFSSPADIGYKAVAVNVSDIAAMGGTARLGLLSLILPPSLPVQDIDGLLDGVVEMAGVSRLTIAGGNISQSPGPLIVDVTVTGSVHPRAVLRRSGGRPGDPLFVTGSLGAAAAGLGWLTAGADQRSDNAVMQECAARHRRPEPRLRIGSLLGRNRAANACIDLSDGLADAVHQIASASGTGAQIDAAALPIHAGAVEWFSQQGADAVAAAISGGDDYELLFAVPRRRAGRLRHVLQQARGVAITRIGELTDDGRVELRRNGQAGPMPAGFSHF